jgi:Na+/melibiose symporter-like transporter
MVYGSGESVPVVANTLIGVYFLTDIVGMSPALIAECIPIGKLDKF